MYVNIAITKFTLLHVNSYGAQQRQVYNGKRPAGNFTFHPVVSLTSLGSCRNRTDLLQVSRALHVYFSRDIKMHEIRDMCDMK